MHYFTPINKLLHNVEHSDEIDDLKINHIVSEINLLLKDTAKRSGTTFKIYKKTHEKKQI